MIASTSVTIGNALRWACGVRERLQMDYEMMRNQAPPYGKGLEPK